MPDEGQILISPAESTQVYLTFDDGPHSEFTPRILGTLRERNAKATFFVIGRKLTDKALADIVVATASEGHTIGNHTLTHPDLTKCSEQEIRTELVATSNLLQELGIDCRLVRPPFGRTNAAIAAIVRELGFEMVLWNNDPRDWVRTIDDWRWAEDAIAAVVQNQATTIVCHDTHARTAQHLGTLIEQLSTRGYSFATRVGPRRDADSK